MDEWDASRARELTALAQAALPEEGLSADELLACCWDDPGIVLATADGDGAISASVRRGDHTIGFVKFIAVHPDAQRRGIGRSLLDAAHSWFRDRGATEVWVGAAAPFYLWPGCDVQHLAALCLFEDCGYATVGAELNMSLATTFRAEPPPGLRVERALDDDVVEAMVTLVRARWPNWEDEAMRAVEHGSCHVAFTDGSERPRAIGFACHSVNRAGWIGPMGTDPASQHGGVGTAMLSQLCRDLQAADVRTAEISSVGPVGFYANAAGAKVSRVFRSLLRPLGSSEASGLPTSVP